MYRYVIFRELLANMLMPCTCKDGEQDELVQRKLAATTHRPWVLHTVSDSTYPTAGQAKRAAKALCWPKE